MKTLIIITAIAFCSLNAQAQSYYTNQGTVYTGISSISTYYCAKDLIKHGNIREDEYINKETCFYSSSFVSTTGILATVVVGALLKEEIKNVQPDAHNYLAGGGMTYALEEVIAKIKDENEDLASLNEEEMVGLIIDIGSQL